jgi:hypothetical protein
MENEFTEFLAKKNIDSEAFQKGDKVLFGNWKNEFQQYHEDSFVMQKKFSINNIRRKYTKKA